MRPLDIQFIAYPATATQEGREVRLRSIYYGPDGYKFAVAAHRVPKTGDRMLPRKWSQVGTEVVYATEEQARAAANRLWKALRTNVPTEEIA